MSESRDAVLGAVRRRVGRNEQDAAGAVASRLDARAAGPIPERGRQTGDALADQFVSEAERVDATVGRVASVDGVPEAVARYLAERNFPARVVVAPDPALGAIDWTTQPTLDVSTAPLTPTDPVAVTGAIAGVGETGTLVLASGPESPTTMNFLPEAHVVVLYAEQLMGSFEALWGHWRGGEGTALPRAVNWITGPSRSGDIEQTLLLGAHGPKRLHIVLVGAASEDGTP